MSATGASGTSAPSVPSEEANLTNARQRVDETLINSSRANGPHWLSRETVSALVDHPPFDEEEEDSQDSDRPSKLATTPLTTTGTSMASPLTDLLTTGTESLVLEQAIFSGFLKKKGERRRVIFSISYHPIRSLEILEYLMIPFD
jgi:hypothetical protein